MIIADEGDSQRGIHSSSCCHHADAFEDLLYAALLAIPLQAVCHGGGGCEVLQAAARGQRWQEVHASQVLCPPAR